MSKIDELIQHLCPNGVEFKSLGELGKFYGGITGKSKEDFKNGNANFITYMNVYKNPALDLNENDKVKILDTENQRKLEFCDVVFTGSSETPNECAFSSVVCEIPKNDYYLNSFCFFLRINNISDFSPHFLKHLFRSPNLRLQLSKTANGVTRFNVSKKQMEKIKIPVPPLAVQEEIVRILDNFTELTAELTAELSLRKKQYEYYRDSLLSFENLAKNGGGYELMSLGDICEIIRGNGLQKKDFTESGFPAIHYGQIYTYYGTSATKTKSFVSPETAKKLKKVNTGDVVITNTSENIEDVCKSVVYFGKTQAVTGGHATIIRPSQDILGKYFVYFTQTEIFAKQKRKYAKGTKVIDVSATDISKFKIPVPSLQTQVKIVEILDKFDTLTNSISEGLPKEIDLRNKQYEYYRDKLLNFKQEVEA